MMKAPPERSFLARLRRALPALHPAERRLGEFVCDFPGELASYDAQELAKFANVSKATVSRFVRRLGYESYDEARRHARAEQRTGSRLFMAHAGDPDGTEASLTHNVEQGKLNLDRTFATITQAQIDAAAQAMLDARKCGWSASAPATPSPTICAGSSPRSSSM
jgi:DNA-binding MurR/RpiR family transcriptional regulator